MKKQVWRKNFEIKRTDYNIAVETAPGFGGLNYLTVGKNIISKLIWVEENLDNTGTYMLKDELRQIVKLTIQAILQEPDKIDRLHKQAVKYNDQYFAFAKELRAHNFSKISDQRLLQLHKKLFNLQYLSHCWALTTTWFTDSDNEDFSKLLFKLVQKKVKQARLRAEPALVFSAFTTPAKTSLGFQEEVESLQMVSWINQTHGLKKWFLAHDIEELITTFPKLKTVWKNKLSRHYEKWRWTPYTYLGPAYDLNYYLEVWGGLVKQKIDPEREITKLHSKIAGTQKDKKRYFQLLNLNPQEQHWFNIAADIVWLKGYRKDTYFHGFFVLDLLLAEIGKRASLSLMQAKHLLPSELAKALKGYDFSNETNERIKFSVIYAETPKGKNLFWRETGIKVFTGARAKAFLKKQKFEKEKPIKTDNFVGTCACPGKVRGIVKVINLPEDMTKMNQNDIMIAHTTFPSLVPAMRKAAAIVTEDGGITCHAAIVARELQTPCVVGCKNILRMVKDGDRVEVDANKGIIRKL